MPYQEKQQMKPQRTIVIYSSRVATALIWSACFIGSPAVADEYFDGLRDRTETILFRAYDSQAEIDADIHANDPDNRVRPPIYDAEQNAARWTTGSGDIAVEDQLRPEFPRVDSGNLLFVWEARWDAGYAGDLGELHTLKAFQLSRTDDRITEIRSRFDHASGSDVAEVDLRGYSSWSPSGQPLEGQINSFTIQGDNWTRFWAFVDFDNRQYSMWVSDEDTAPVQLFNRLQYSSMSGGLDSFWFEFNSSQTGGPGGLRLWGRNLAVLRDVSDVESIVFDGVTVRPRPPSNVQGEFVD